MCLVARSLSNRHVETNGSVKGRNSAGMFEDDVQFCKLLFKKASQSFRMKSSYVILGCFMLNLISVCSCVLQEQAHKTVPGISLRVPLLISPLHEGK